MHGVVVLGGCLYALVLLALSAIQVADPQRNGPLALSQVVAPFLFVPLLLFIPSAVADRPWRGRALLRLLLVVCLVVAGLRFGPEWVSLPGHTGNGARVGVTAWNVEAGLVDPTVLLDRIANAPVGVVVISELSKRDAALIGGDQLIRARFPAQQLFPKDGSTGIGLLSSYPILDTGNLTEDPPLIWATLDLGEGKRLAVVGAHPLPGDLRPLGVFGAVRVPLDYDATKRDQQLHEVNVTAKRLLAGDIPVIVAGDFNVTDREPGYEDLLAGGLRDAHRQIGFGPGGTWRPDPIKWLPLGLLRIDLVLTGNGAAAASLDADCTPVGTDHCRLTASVALP